MNTSGRNIGGDEGLCLTALEGLQCPLTLGLGAVAMDGNGGDSLCLELACHAIGTPAGPTEHDGLAELSDHRRTLRHALVTGHRPEVVSDVSGGFVVASHIDTDGITEVARGESLDLLAHGGAEQQNLAVRLGLVENTSHHGQEAHIGHAVGLVDHDETHLREIHHSLLDQVLEPSRAGHKDVDALVECRLGRPVAGSAVNGDDPTGTPLHDRAKLISDLCCELSGGLQDQTTGPSG